MNRLTEDQRQDLRRQVQGWPALTEGQVARIAALLSGAVMTDA